MVSKILMSLNFLDNKEYNALGKIIRILHVLGRLDRGGAETMVMNLYRKIDKTKVQFDFIIHTTDKCDYNDEIKSLGGKIYSVPQYKGVNHLEYKKAWNVFLKGHPEYKIIHGHVRSTASIYLNIAKKYGLITIAHSHSTSSGTGLSAITKNLLQYPIRYVADYLFACSKDAGKWLYGQRACSKENFNILNNAIDLNMFKFNNELRESKRNELKIQDKFVIGHIGRFDIAKNHHFLIDIFKEIHYRNGKTVLLLIGDGELKESVEKKVAEYGLKDEVIFTGVRSDIPELLHVMDVFLFPSLYEGLPVTVVEAQASGLPCVISDNITNEVSVTSLVNKISLQRNKEYWAETVLQFQKSQMRESPQKEIKDSHYDISEVSKQYQDFIIKHYYKS